MTAVEFRTDEGRVVPSVTTGAMREVDRVAVDEVGLPLASMMENAGRNLARVARSMLADAVADGDAPGSGATAAVVVLAGGGGNGGGGLACARHLANHASDDGRVGVVLDREPGTLTGVPAAQLSALRAAGVEPTDDASVVAAADLVVDALVGYGQADAPRGRTADLIATCEDAGAVLSLDVPSGVDATTGEAHGVAVSPDRTLTLALPKPGLADRGDDLLLADIGIPAGVYERAGIDYESPFDGRYVVPLAR